MKAYTTKEKYVEEMDKCLMSKFWVEAQTGFDINQIAANLVLIRQTLEKIEKHMRK